MSSELLTLIKMIFVSTSTVCVAEKTEMENYSTFNILPFAVLS